MGIIKEYFYNIECDSCKKLASDSWEFSTDTINNVLEGSNFIKYNNKYYCSNCYKEVNGEIEVKEHVKLYSIIIPKEIKDKFLNGEILHVVRDNVPKWEQRINAIREGKAELVVRYWEGQPYKGTLTDICRLGSEISIQSFKFTDSKVAKNILVDNKKVLIEDFANDEGRTVTEWKYAMRKFHTKEPLAIINFTAFKYGDKKYIRKES